MTSQLDLDQSGTHRQTQRVYLGPSVGWVDQPDQWELRVTATGTTTILRGTNLILVSVNADGVIIQLPSSLRTASPQAIPNQSLITPVVVLDSGGYAYAHNIRILPFGSELIDGLTFIDLTSAFGAYVLRPNINTGGWTLAQ